jgi:predicted dehydrogenase/threonine dehydrogenase-like Zn-dependent dehydrogenase
MLVEFGRASLLEKAKSQPDKVAAAIAKMKTDGIAPTLEAIRSKLDTPISLGYCQAGVVREVGPDVSEFRIGDRVVTNGPHAEYVRVVPTLAARIPEGVSFEAAAFTPLAAIGLEGLRLANPTLGETFVIYGLGPIGLLTIQLARAAGCKVIALDKNETRVKLAATFGAKAIVTDGDADPVAAVLELTNGVGADAVLLTLATDSDEPVHNAAQMSRKRGRIVLVGVTGLSLKRDDFYKKELSFQVSCSYGPGRYEPQHEERAVDYPLPYVRWTEGRNFSAVLELMADGRLDPTPLVTHRFDIGQADEAYRLLTEEHAALGVLLSYQPKQATVDAASRVVALKDRLPAAATGRVALIGAGNFATRVLVPALERAGASMEIVASSGGVSAAITARKYGFRRATSDAAAAIKDPAVDTVVIATRHDTHASLTIEALENGKHVFVEKPLALSNDELRQVAEAVHRSPGLLAVGFNRRFAPHVQFAHEALGSRNGPLLISITVNAGRLPADHWALDPEIGGGRIVGEACHFIDLVRFLAGRPIARLQVLPANSGGQEPITDIVLLQLSFDDGSIATIQYFSSGSKAFPKERVELSFDGKTLRIDNFRKIESWGLPSRLSGWPRRQDKGHTALAAAFLSAVKAGKSPPIPFEELLESSFFSIEAERLARQGGGEVTRESFVSQFATE